MTLIPFIHHNGDRVCVAAEDLKSERTLIGLYNEDGTKRSRAAAWLGDGKPSDIGLETAREAIKKQYAEGTHLLDIKVQESTESRPR